MQKILVNKANDVVMLVTRIANIVENGIHVGDSIVANPSNYIAVYAVDGAVPANAAGQYCYTPENGFTPNPDYRGTDLDDNIKGVTDLKKQMATVMLMLAKNNIK